jgi:hypothetical protein
MKMVDGFSNASGFAPEVSKEAGRFYSILGIKRRGINPFTQQRESHTASEWSRIKTDYQLYLAKAGSGVTPAQAKPGTGALASFITRAEAARAEREAAKAAKAPAVEAGAGTVDNAPAAAVAPAAAATAPAVETKRVMGLKPLVFYALVGAVVLALGVVSVVVYKKVKK